MKTIAAQSAEHRQTHHNPSSTACNNSFTMTMYDEVEIEDMTWDDELGAFTYQCPCGDLFQITRTELSAGEEIAHCPSCTLVVRVIYDPEDFAKDASNKRPRTPPRVVVPPAH